LEDKTQVGKRASELYCNGYNCAKCVYMAVTKELGENEPDEKIIRICSAFGGGIGRSGSVCGALLGSQIVLAGYTGKIGKDDSGDCAYIKAAEFLEKFRNKFGSTDCKDINKGDFVSVEHEKRCSYIVSWASEKVLDRILELKKKVENK